MYRIQRIRREKRIRRMRRIRLTRQIRPYPHVPDEILLHLFRHIPLSDLILSVGRVCTDWARVQRTELARRHTVMIFQEDYQLKAYREQQNPFGSELITRVLRDDGETAWHQLQPLKQIRFNAIRMLPNLKEEHTSFLMDIMPDITHLSVAYQQDHDTNHHSSLLTLKQLTRLTNHYTTSLESFTLDFHCDNDAFYFPNFNDSDSDIDKIFIQCNDSAFALFESIGRIGPLRHLMLTGSYPFLYSNIENVRLDLSRLDTFVIHDLCFSEMIYSILKHAPERANIRFACGAGIPLDSALAFTPPLAHNCVRFTLWDLLCSFDYEDFQRFCDRFVSLTTLHMHLHSVGPKSHEVLPAMTLWARCLARLPELVHLSLSAGNIPEDEPHPQRPLVPVTTVRLLSLTMSPPSHRHTERLHLDELFPNLQVLDLTHYIDQCDECGFGCSSGEPNREQRVANCRRLARQPFKRCANLHTIKLNAGPFADDLRPQVLITKDQL